MALTAPPLTAPTDRDASGDEHLRALFDRARAGDDRALDQLCRLMRPRLYRAAWSVLRDADDADDVAQEALVRAVTKRFLFLGSGSVGGWMTRIALNLAKNRRRDHGRRGDIVAAALPAELVARGALADDLQGPDARLLALEDQTRLARAVATLSERQQDVVRLRAVVGLDFKAVGETLGITEENARVTFSQAKKKLVTLLTDPARGAP